MGLAAPQPRARRRACRSRRALARRRAPDRPAVEGRAEGARPLRRARSAPPGALVHHHRGHHPVPSTDAIVNAFRTLLSAGCRPPQAWADSPEAKAETVRTWHAALPDVDDAALRAAVDGWLVSAASPWWPMPAEVRRYAPRRLEVIEGDRGSDPTPSYSVLTELERRLVLRDAEGNSLVLDFPAIETRARRLRPPGARRFLRLGPETRWRVLRGLQLRDLLWTLPEDELVEALEGAADDTPTRDLRVREGGRHGLG